MKREGKSSGESETTDSKFLTADIRSGSEKRFRVFAGRPLDALPAFAQAFDFPVPPVETRRFSLSPWSSSQPQRSTRFGLGGREAIRPWPCGADVWCRRRRGGLSSPSCSRACQPGRVSFSFFVADGLAGWGRAPRRRRGAPDGEGARVETEILEKVGRHRHGE